MNLGLQLTRRQFVLATAMMAATACRPATTRVQKTSTDSSAKLLKNFSDWHGNDLDKTTEQLLKVTNINLPELNIKTSSAQYLGIDSNTAERLGLLARQAAYFLNANGEIKVVLLGCKTKLKVNDKEVEMNGAVSRYESGLWSVVCKGTKLHSVFRYDQ